VGGGGGQTAPPEAGARRDRRRVGSSSLSIWSIGLVPRTTLPSAFGEHMAFQRTQAPFRAFSSCSSVAPSDETVGIVETSGTVYFCPQFQSVSLWKSHGHHARSSEVCILFTLFVYIHLLVLATLPQGRDFLALLGNDTCMGRLLDPRLSTNRGLQIRLPDCRLGVTMLEWGTDIKICLAWRL
jgi:hypothetical protein